MNSAKNILKKSQALDERLEREVPELLAGYKESYKHYFKEGVISPKYKQLMAVSSAVAVKCTPCMLNHANKALQAGASRQEIIESAIIGVQLGGGPSFVLVRNRLIEFLDELENKNKSI